jgi:hypothetical protein
MDSETFGLQIKSYNGNGMAELVAAKEILEIAQQAKQLFMSSKLDEKQQLLSFFFSNLSLNAGNLDLELREPFKYMSKSQDQHVWRPLVDMFRNDNTVFGVSLQSVQTAFTNFGMQHPMPMV